MITFYDFLRLDMGLIYSDGDHSLGRSTIQSIRDDVEETLGGTAFGVSHTGYWADGLRGGAGFVIFHGDHEWFFGFPTTSIDSVSVRDSFDANYIRNFNGTSASSNVDMSFVFGYNCGVGHWGFGFDDLENRTFLSGDMSEVEFSPHADSGEMSDFLPNKYSMPFQILDSVREDDSLNGAAKMVVDDQKPVVNMYATFSTQPNPLGIICSGDIFEDHDKNGLFSQELSTFNPNRPGSPGGIVGDSSSESASIVVTEDGGDFELVASGGFEYNNIPFTNNKFPYKPIIVRGDESFFHIDPEVACIAGLRGSSVDICRHFELSNGRKLVKWHESAVYMWPDNTPSIPICEKEEIGV